MILLDGISIQVFGFIATPGHSNPITPVYENKTLSISGRSGLYDFGSELKEKEISIQLTLIDLNTVQKQFKIRKLITFLMDTYGKPRNFKLSFDYEPDKYYTARVTSQIDPERIVNTGSLVLELTAFDPFMYSYVYEDEINWGSNVITFQSSYLMGHMGSAGITTVTINKTLDYYVDGLAIKPVIEITGSATTLVLSANGYTITFPAFASKTWIIDCDKYTVLKNGVNSFSEVSLRDFFLLTGSNVLSITGTGMNFTIRIKIRDKYI